MKLKEDERKSRQIMKNMPNKEEFILDLGWNKIEFERKGLNYYCPYHCPVTAAPCGFTNRILQVMDSHVTTPFSEIPNKSLFRLNIYTV